MDHPLTLFACAGHLAVGALAASRGARSPMARPLALLCADFFAFNAAPFAERLAPARAWASLDSAASSMLAPLSVHLLLAFAGRRRSLAWLLRASYAVHGAIAGACALALLPVPWARAFARSPSWAVLVLASSLAFVGAALALVVPAHWRRHHDVLERARTRTLMAAFATGMLLCPTELLSDAGARVPRLADVGTLGTAVLFAVATLRFNLFEREVSRMLALKAAVVAGLSLAVCVATFRYLASPWAMAAFAAVTLAVGLLPAVRDVVETETVLRERERHLATLGRFSAQMAHDLQNPIAAARGAAQLLLRERGDGALSEAQASYVRLIQAQMDRMLHVVTDYRRLGRMEPDLGDGDLAELAAAVVAAQAGAAPEGVTVTLDAPASLPMRFDRDLLARALENLLRNAFEATRARGGAVTVRVRPDGDAAELSVRDDGEGMSPRVAERAFDDFFTTRASGSGLGLALVRRVAEAHRGGARIESAEGEGTTVTLLLGGAAPPAARGGVA